VGKARIHADDTRINAEASQQKSASSQRKSAGRVVAIERIPQLTETAKRNIGKYSFIEKGIASVLCADGSKGYAAEAPYDRIIASASGREIPQAWKDQLAIGGRIVAPVENSIILIEKVSKDEFKEQEYFGFSFVPLVEGDRG
jgi:protein-L-isoaspartate(D-aspartate) O-methyltransferase